MKSIFRCTMALVAFGIWGCQTESTEYQAAMANPEYMHRAMKGLTDQIVHDIFSPPVASRIYAYSSIAAYEALAPSHSEHSTLAGQLNQLGAVPAPPAAGQPYSPELAAIHAFLMVGQPLVHSGSSLASFRDGLYETIKEETRIPQKDFDNSLAYGNQVAEHIKAWMSQDGYAETRTFPKYTIRPEEAYWKPTPPDYMEGIEPSWNKLRTFVLDSATQFIPAPPTPFDMDPNSLFYKELMEVYETGVNLDEEQTEIAKFWDCNPYVSQHFLHRVHSVTKMLRHVGVTVPKLRDFVLDSATQFIPAPPTPFDMDPNSLF
ncbi:MAG: phosphatidic acid phosphatase, partial [Bacteroidota bacterium]